VFIGALNHWVTLVIHKTRQEVKGNVYKADLVETKLAELKRRLDEKD
jgi:hypothetical protein